MGNTTVKIGETSLVVNERGQLCELVNLPVNVFRKHKGEILEFDSDTIIADPVNGLTGKYGTIHFIYSKLNKNEDLGW